MKKFQYHMISDRTLYRQPIAQVAAEAEEAGVHYFQLREKDLGPRELFSLAQEIRPLLRETLLIINGSLDIALASKANGVHLQKNNIPVAAVRTRYKELMIGYSAHSLDEMKEAEHHGADYVFISPVFQPASKSINISPHGIHALASWTKLIKIPVFALGGVSVQNLPDVKQSGCSGAAGISLFVDKGRFTSGGMVM